ncbi:MAG: efflux RND transporter periplasmic adaptor subunit [bacterium]|nr:efflux RND transporter periplasmic adaptor subunit [bacterium]
MRKARIVFILLLAAFVLGYAARGCGARERGAGEAETGAAEAERRTEIWTCSMHPQIRAEKPGKCPLCGMDLIPVSPGGPAAGAGRPTLTVSEEARRLMEIRTAPVTRGFPSAEILMTGKIAFDETRVKYITAWVGGRLDRLFVDYTGVPVREGDHMVLIYSPEIVSAQEELIQAARAAAEMEGSGLDVMRRRTLSTLEAASGKLRLWGLTDGQIREIEERGAATDHITIYAPISGIVIDKNAREGMYVETGTRIYTIADLTHVWALLDAYESDMMWIRYGQDVEFTVEAYPGQTFHGRISFIDPVLDERTRTVKLRVDVDNPDGRLKPEMFVRATVRARVAAAGRVMEPDLEGKWICPMHPNIIGEDPGDCTICGMPLVTTESLGYVRADPPAEAPLLIPASAPLVTGRRAVVYVEAPGHDLPTFEGREVTLGPRAGDSYIVEAGLAEGERVVTRGNFKIDSQLQIEARPSMMSPEGGAPPAVHHHDGEAAPPAADPHAGHGAMGPARSR